MKRNIDKLLAALFAEIDAFTSDTRLEREVNNELTGIKKNWLLSHKQNLKNNNHWLYEINEAARYNTRLSRFTDFPKRFAAVNVKQIRAIAKRYLNKENCIQVVLKPEAHAQHSVVGDL